ncbi:MAG: DJ-1/PfpI family protein [Lachnospiraceae bacterium]|jgi:4-methyl-5(b-hydroxyethyl)-thiazole monophosphate biosynthesis|nr:DJ-1 family glyoxalase III [uncultured Acetatifactor sp.]MCI9221373.1 DJ-1/PfpI family protein [Lachnospiraceae bacterium]
MKKIGVFFGTGFEEIEALTVVDICRRCGLDVEMVSVMEAIAVTGSHGITVETDKMFSEADFPEYDMLVLPGGGEGTKNLEAHGGLMEQVDAFYAAGKYIAAICAAPSIFGHRGILKGRNACCYPVFESHLEGAHVTAGPVEISDHVVTSRGMGTAIDFALAIAGIFCGQEKAQETAESIIYRKAE